MGLLFSFCRKPDKRKLEDFLNYPYDTGSLEKSWRESPDYTMKILFLHRKNYKYKKQYNNFIRYLADNHPSQFKKYIPDLPYRGTYKDLLSLFDTKLESDMIEYYLDTQDPISVKYAPTEGCYHDRQYNAVSKFCDLLGCTKKQYRVFLSKKRKKLNIVESFNTTNIKNIDTTKIGKRAKNKYNNLLKENVTQKYMKPYNIDHINVISKLAKLPIQESLYNQSDKSFTSFVNNSGSISSLSLHTFLLYYGSLMRGRPQKYLSNLSIPSESIIYTISTVSNPINDRIFFVGYSYELYLNLDNPSLYDIVFWNPNSTEGFKFYERPEDRVYYVVGLNEKMLKYFLYSNKISMKSWIDKLL